MGKAKIGFEVDEDDLVNAKAFVATHGGSLNKLVSALFASLGRAENDRKPSIDPATSVLMAVSAGKISIMEAARRLELPDAGYVFHRLAGASLPLPRLSAADLKHQLASAKNALDACLVEPIPGGKKSARATKRGAKQAAAA